MSEEAIRALDAAFAATPRPEHFTNYRHCCECWESDEFFQHLTPAELASLADPPETLPLCFLTDTAFHYFMPAFARMLFRTGQQYCVGDVLFLIENKLDTFDGRQKSALRDLLYAVYEQSAPQIHSGFYDYEAIWRILNRLEDVG